MNSTNSTSKDGNSSNFTDSAEIEDTHERAREAAGDQIARTQAVQAEQNEVVYSALNLWEEYFETAYSRDIKIRIRSDLPLDSHNKVLHLLTQVSEEIESNTNPFTKVLCLITLGLFKDDTPIQDTDADFWNNSENWSLRKVQNVISSYLINYTKGMNEVTSFLRS